MRRGNDACHAIASGHIASAMAQDIVPNATRPPGAVKRWAVGPSREDAEQRPPTASGQAAGASGLVSLQDAALARCYRRTIDCRGVPRRIPREIGVERGYFCRHTGSWAASLACSNQRVMIVLPRV